LPVASCKCHNIACCQCCTTAGSLADAQISCAVWASAARSAQCQQHLVSEHLPNNLHPCRPPTTCMGDPRVIIFWCMCMLPYAGSLSPVSLPLMSGFFGQLQVRGVGLCRWLPCVCICIASAHQGTAAADSAAATGGEACAAGTCRLSCKCDACCGWQTRRSRQGVASCWARHAGRAWCCRAGLCYA
jgi:hypothetical protein